jgi:hypothetical protein
VNPVMAGVLLAVALFGCGYWLGAKQAAATCAADQALVQQTTQVEANKESDRKEAVGVAREVSRGQISVTYREIKDEAVKNVGKNSSESVPSPPGDMRPYDCGLDADGLRVWDAANAGVAPLSGEPDYRLLDSALGEIGKIGRLVAEPRRVDGAVRAVPRPAQEVGGMRE